ncbi:hypothetical protein E0H73_38565 [Kribbella pittospori]|uniref:Uncharacterized protein n=1 Tax=Kribbella pittospori TaxID=722689 RepID=A0A4R0K2Z9_9ACTN|nr:hypothetical protein [Kribbella pittospori]TCC54363.1 hypothetical protein E0H73_38565 [Kribbella pittospori]
MRDSRALGAIQLMLAVLASVVGTVLTGFFDAGRPGTLVGAGIAPLITAVFTTRGRGASRGLSIVLLTALALLLTVSGFTISDVLRDGESPVADRDGTFWKAPGSSSGSRSGNTSSLSAPDQVECKATEVHSTSDCRFGLEPAGTTTVSVSGATLDGRDQDDFRITKQCKGTLKPGTACSIRLKFTPSAEGDRSAEVIVKLPNGSRVVGLVGQGIAGSSNGCRDGFEPRRATADDNVCVTSVEHEQALQQNQAHQDEHRDRGDGSCVEGFVWREATSVDHICVTPTERDEAAQQNAKSSERSAS